ncbi:MAG: hypothetical protein WCV83_01820 [Candidatus Magasanikbacteria bacterium]
MRRELQKCDEQGSQTHWTTYTHPKLEIVFLFWMIGGLLFY